MEELTEEEKKALRGSKFAPLPATTAPSRSQSRLAHPAGPMKTNKAAALAKFLERKLHQDPNGLSSVDPKLVELAVKDAKRALHSSGVSNSGRTIHHVDSFDDYEGPAEKDARNSAKEQATISAPKKGTQKRKDRKKNKQQKMVEDSAKQKAKKRKKKKLRLADY